MVKVSIHGQMVKFMMVAGNTVSNTDRVFSQNLTECNDKATGRMAYENGGKWMLT